MCPRGRPRGQRRPQGLHLCKLFVFSFFFGWQLLRKRLDHHSDCNNAFFLRVRVRIRSSLAKSSSRWF